MSNVNWSTNLGLLTGVVCRWGVRGGSITVMAYCGTGPSCGGQPRHRYDLSPAAADLRTSEFWHWLCTLSLSFSQHLYPCHPSRCCLSQVVKVCPLFNRPKWRLFPPDCPVWWPVSSGWCDAFPFSSAATRSPPLPTSAVWTSFFGSGTTLLPEQQHKNKHRVIIG